VGFDAAANTPIEYKDENGDTDDKDWRLLADQLLPRVAPPIACDFLLTSEGLPLFPSVDMNSVTAAQLQEILKIYFSQVWGESVHFMQLEHKY
jgi:hypothetical protein